MAARSAAPTSGRFSVGWLIIGLAVSLLLHLGATIILALVPWHIFLMPGETLPGTSIGRYFDSGGHLIMLAVPAALCITTIYLERRVPDRFSPVILCALVLGLQSLFFCLEAMQELAVSFPELYPVGLVRLSVGASALSVLLALGELFRMVLTRSPMRGKGIAAGIVVGVAWVGYLQKVLVLDSEGMPLAQNGVVLARVQRTYSRPLEAGPHGYEPAFVHINAGGQIHLDGTPQIEADDDLLTRRLSALVNEDGNEFLWLRADARAPFGSLVRLHRLASRLEVDTLWVHCLFELELSQHPGWRVGSVGIGVRRPSGEQQSQRTIVLRAGNSTRPTRYELEDGSTHGIVSLLDTLGTSRGSRGLQLVLRASSDVEWQQVALLMDHLLSRDWILEGLELLD